MNRELKNPRALRELNRRRKPRPESAMTHMGPTAQDLPLVAGRRVAKVAGGVVEVAMASMADVGQRFDRASYFCSKDRESRAMPGPVGGSMTPMTPYLLVSRRWLYVCA